MPAQAKSRCRGTQDALASTPMVTPEEVERVPYFAALRPESRERLARAAADINLASGEYAAHEGDGRALFALLEGHIEVVKLVDGITRVVGERHPGELIGEVPITLGHGLPRRVPRC